MRNGVLRDMLVGENVCEPSFEIEMRSLSFLRNKENQQRPYGAVDSQTSGPC